MIAKMPVSSAGVDSYTDWPNTPKWFTGRAGGQRVCLRTDGVTIPAWISNETSTGLTLQAADPGGLSVGRLFVSQLVQVVHGNQRIAGTIRSVHGRFGNYSITLSLTYMATTRDLVRFAEDDEIIVCAC